MRADLLHLLSVLRVATTAQCYAVATPNAASTRYVRRGLRALQADGLADGTATGRSGAMVWYLTSLGARSVAESEGRAAPRRRAISPALVRSGLLRHALDVTALAASFAPAGAEVGDWSVEKVHRYGRGGELRLITDAVLQIPEHPGRRLPTALLVELDRATMSTDRLLGELAAYADYARGLVTAPGGRRARGLVPAHQRDYPGTERCPPVLVVLTGAEPAALVRRADRLARAVADRERAFEVVDIGVAILADLVEYGPLTRVVMPLDDPGVRVGVDRLARREYETGDWSNRQTYLGREERV